MSKCRLKVLGLLLGTTLYNAGAMEVGTNLQILRGKAILPYISEITALRLSFFYEYPYFYEGSNCCEEEYLRTYVNTEDGIAILLREGQKTTGVLTGLPLDAAIKQARQPFYDKKLPTAHIFCLGEFILPQVYRGSNLERQMYQQMELLINDLGYTKVLVCEIDEPENAIKRPASYIPMTDFWAQQGFNQDPALTAYFLWKNIGASEETKHLMNYFVKIL